MRKLQWVVLILVALSSLVWLGVKDAIAPVMRSDVDSPIFTVGDGHYRDALASGSQVLKFGRLFWGIYPGGLAFESAEAATQYLHLHKEELETISSDWSVYRLSGEYQLDTYVKDDQRYIKSSMLVLAESKI